VAPADAYQKFLSCASLATVADVSPVTVAVQSSESWCLEPVLLHGQRLASDNVNSPSPHCTRKVVLTRRRYYHDPFPGDVGLRYHTPIGGPTISPVGLWVLKSS